MYSAMHLGPLDLRTACFQSDLQSRHKTHHKPWKLCNASRLTLVGSRVRASIESSGNLFFKPGRVSFSPALHGSVKMQATAGSFVGTVRSLGFTMALRRAVVERLPSLTCPRALSTISSKPTNCTPRVTLFSRSITSSYPSAPTVAAPSPPSPQLPSASNLFGSSVVASSPAHSLHQESAAAIAGETAIRNGPRNDWTREEIQAIYDSPLMDLLLHGAQVHKHTHKWREVQQCTLMSIKTGGCSEDCSYCPQSSRYDTGVKAHKLLSEDLVLEAARKAKEAGSSRFCMGAAWRDTVGRKTNFNQILDYVKEIRGMGMEVCCTLGMLEKKQAEQLKTAGLTAYNHNLDTSREYYPNIITTRSYDERLKTLELVRDAGISVCSGGIIGLGEADEDRVGLLHTLATLTEHPESVPINALLAVKGTPLENQKPVEIWEMVRMIATARLVMPKSMVRLSAGRVRFSQPEQALCFMAGANSIFTGEKLLTTPNNDKDADQEMFTTLGLIPKPPNFEQGRPDSPDEDSESDLEPAISA